MEKTVAVSLYPIKFFSVFFLFSFSKKKKRRLSKYSLIHS